MDSVHGVVGHADPVHREPTAIAASSASSSLGGRGCQRRSGGGRGKHGGPDSGLTGARKVAERRRDDGEGGGGGALNAGSLGAWREGKEGRVRSGGRSGCWGALL
jgi:hypothetical protein